MSFVTLRQRIGEYDKRPALHWRGQEYSYADLHARVEVGERALAAARRGSVIAVEGDYSPDAIAMLIAAGCAGHVVVPLLPWADARAHGIAEAEWVARDGVVRRTGRRATHALLRGEGARLVLFTSGTTGTPKGLVHDADQLLAKYVPEGKCLRTVALLLFDHIGGLDTMFYALFNGSMLCVPESTRPADVCRTIEAAKAEVLPAAPSFLNLMLLAGAHRESDLSSLKIVTFGSEPIAPALVARLRDELPAVKLIQKYGLSELGTLQTKSDADDPTRVKVDGRGFEARVREGKLELRGALSFLGYLNSDEQPFTDDGWYRTGDLVEIDGEYLRIRGRERYLVNIGGEKVNPTEVEDVVAELDEVESVVVRGEPHPLLGNILVATVHLGHEVAKVAFEKKLVGLCRARLARHKVPHKIVYTSQSLVNERMKKRVS